MPDATTGGTGGRGGQETGGTMASNGGNSVGTGGAGPGTSGAGGVVATGTGGAVVVPGTGGAPTGGSTASGGVTASGGSGGGGRGGSGGVPATGGNGTGVGGTSATGGAGTSATGGSAGAGGVIASGGNTATGGAGGVISGTGGGATETSAIDTTPHAVCSGFRALSGPLSGLFSYDVGHAADVMQVAIAGERMLSRDSAGHWNLWNATARLVVARGDLACLPSDQECIYRGVDLAGDLLVVETNSGAFELRSARDGQLIATVALPGGRPHLEASGKYVWTASATGLRTWSATGQPVLAVSGDYSSAKVFAGATELRAAGGPAGAAMVERIPLPTGGRTSVPFSGTFGFWFRDGERFLTRASNTYTVYAKDGTPQKSLIVATGTIDAPSDGGYGDYFWLGGGPIYRVGGNSMPLARVDGGVLAQVVPGSFVVDQSLFAPSGDTLTQYTFPSLIYSEPSRISSAIGPDGHWIRGGQYGTVTDSRSPLPGQSISCGPVRTAHGNPIGDLAVVMKNSRDMLLFHFAAAGPGAPTRYPWGLERAHLTDDGKKVAISGVGALMSAGMSRGPGVEVRALPGGEVFAAWGAGLGAGMQNGRISGDGELVAFEYYFTSSSRLPVNSSVYSIVGGTATPLYTGAFNFPLALAPRGHLFTVSPNVTEVRRDTTVLSMIDAFVTTWLDETKILSASNLFGMAPGPVRIYGTQGTVLSTPPLPQMTVAVPVGADRVLEPSPGAIYNVTSGQKVWSATLTVDGPWARDAQGDNGPGATTLAGPYAVYGHSAELIAEKY